MAFAYDRQYQLVVVLLLAALGLILLGFAGVVSEETVRGILVPASWVMIGVGLGTWLWNRLSS